MNVSANCLSCSFACAFESEPPSVDLEVLTTKASLKPRATSKHACICLSREQLDHIVIKLIYSNLHIARPVPLPCRSPRTALTSCAVNKGAICSARYAFCGIMSGAVARRARARSESEEQQQLTCEWRDGIVHRHYVRGGELGPGSGKES